MCAFAPDGWVASWGAPELSRQQFTLSVSDSKIHLRWSFCSCRRKYCLMDGLKNEGCRVWLCPCVCHQTPMGARTHLGLQNGSMVIVADGTLQDISIGWAIGSKQKIHVTPVERILSPHPWSSLLAILTASVVSSSMDVWSTSRWS